MKFSVSGEIVTKVHSSVVRAVNASDVLRRCVGLYTEAIWSFLTAATFQSACNSSVAGLCL